MASPGKSSTITSYLPRLTSRAPPAVSPPCSSSDPIPTPSPGTLALPDPLALKCHPVHPLVFLVCSLSCCWDTPGTCPHTVCDFTCLAHIRYSGSVDCVSAWQHFWVIWGMLTFLGTSPPISEIRKLACEPPGEVALGCIGADWTLEFPSVARLAPGTPGRPVLHSVLPISTASFRI